MTYESACKVMAGKTTAPLQIAKKIAKSKKALTRLLAQQQN
jgi:hypothetical protein